MANLATQQHANPNTRPKRKQTRRTRGQAGREPAQKQNQQHNNKLTPSQGRRESKKEELP
jgi:hypothetical protein